MPISPHYKPWSISFFGILIICISSLIFFSNLKDQFDKAATVYKVNQGIITINKGYSFYLKMVAEKRSFHLRLNEEALEYFKNAKTDFTRVQKQASQLLSRKQDLLLFENLSVQYDARVAQLDRHIQYLLTLPTDAAITKINNEFDVSLQLENTVQKLFDQLIGQLNDYSIATENERMRLQRINIISFIVITLLGLLLIIVVNYTQIKFGQLKIKKRDV